MSRTLLASLNQERRGSFYDWLDEHPGEPRIAWYPAAGIDFRPLLYLSKKYKERKHLTLFPEGMPEAPDIFLFTDYATPLQKGRSYMPSVLPISYEDEWTKVSLSGSERLGRLHCLFDPLILNEVSGCMRDTVYSASPDFGHVYFLLLNIESDRLKNFQQPVIYVFAENATFFTRVLIPHKARISHLIYKRGMGASFPWLPFVLKRLRTEVVYGDTPFNGNSLEHTQEWFDRVKELEGGTDDAPDASQWNDLGDGWYTKKKPQQG